MTEICIIFAALPLQQASHQKPAASIPSSSRNLGAFLTQRDTNRQGHFNVQTESVGNRERNEQQCNNFGMLVSIHKVANQ